jgi:hypothetical protein
LKSESLINLMQYYRLDLRSEGEENFEAFIKTKKRLSFGNAMFPLFLSFDRREIFAERLNGVLIFWFFCIKVKEQKSIV